MSSFRCSSVNKEGVGPGGSLEGLLKKIITEMSGKGRPTEESMTALWEEAAGSKAAKHSRPVSLVGSRLVVNVDGSSWLYELTTRKKEILAKIAEKTKKIKELRFRIGDINKNER